jgi:hypothetical protein
MSMKNPLFLSCLLLATSGVAGAQAPPTPATPPAQATSPAPGHATGCTPTQSTPQGNIAPKDGTTGQSQEPLADKLARSDGVLCPPPGVDPAMRAPAPDAGNMPVIPPPGSPGGDPTIRPK